LGGGAVSVVVGVTVSVAGGQVGGAVLVLLFIGGACAGRSTRGRGTGRD